jgi:hypothetical protein
MPIDVTNHMIFQRISTIETLSTFFTPITPLTAMNQAMLIVDGTSQEALSTNRTQEGTFTRMTLTDVIIQIGTDCKTTPTSFNRTCKRLNALMESQVLPQMR